MKPCDYDIALWPRPAERCGQPATHLCLVEDVNDDGPYTRRERRCDRHATTDDVLSKEALNDH